MKIKIKKLAFLSTIFAILLPTLVVATVIISYTYPITGTSVSPKIYLAEGPNYNTAIEMDLISLTNSTSNGIMSQTIKLSNITGSYNVQLLNVLYIYNTSGWDTYHAPVWVYINVSSQSHVAVGVSQSEVFWFSSATNDTSTESYQLTSAHPTVYISFLLWSNGASSVTYSATVTISYYVGTPP